MNNPVAFPAPVSSLLDDRMWASIARKDMALPYCERCSTAVYPPAPCCPHCFQMPLPWKSISGDGVIVSWTRFHRTYLPAYPAPYTVIAVKLQEGPIMISNLLGEEPGDDVWIGRRVQLRYDTVHPERVLPRFELCSDT